MKTFFSKLRFQSKVLIPVVVIIITLTVATILVVNERIARQLETQVSESLRTSETVFRKTQEIRAKNLLLRYRTMLTDARCKALSQYTKPKMLRTVLSGLAEELGADVIQFTTDQTKPLASASREQSLDLTEFHTHAAASVGFALEGIPTVDIISAGGRLYDVVSVPVSVGDRIIGALTFANAINNNVASEFRQLTGTEIVLLANGQVACSTLSKPEFLQPITSFFENLPAPKTQKTAGHTDIVTLNGHRYLYLTGGFDSLGGGKLGFALLSSYDAPLAALRDTQRTIILVGLFGAFISAVTVFILIRRISQPLRELGRIAEAVGRGDFSQRAPAVSHDECGELAEVFNRMTKNLQTSHAELEETIEKLKTARLQLTQSEKLAVIGEFVAGIAHELNNPLASVIGFSQLLQNSEMNTRDRHHLDRVVNEAGRCHKIVQGLLGFARQHKPERKPLDVNNLVESALDILRYQLRTNNIEAVTHLAPKIPKVVGDSHQLQQVFINLINNARQAIEAAQPQGKISVTTEALDERVRVTVQDDGPGISEENLAKLFTPFFTTKEVGKGTGLGLSLCYGIINEHSGTINVRSRKGEGATFVIELPIAPATADAETEAPAAAPETTAKGIGSGKRVLVVDDEEAIRELISVALGAENYQVDTASDGEMALLKTNKNRYDLIVSDWKMPGMNGQQFYSRLRESDPDAAKRFIFLTGDVVGVQRLVGNSHNNYLAKPFSLTQLCDTVNKVMMDN